MALGIQTALRGLSKSLKDTILDLVTSKYNVNQSGSNAQTITGSVVATQYIHGKKIGVFGYLSQGKTVTITTANEYQFIEGTFYNDVLQGFTADLIEGQPYIVYNEPITQYYQIDWHASLKSQQMHSLISIGIRKNSDVLIPSIMTVEISNSNTIYVLSGTVVVQLAQYDTIQLVITSNTDNDVIDVLKFTTTLNEFFD